jgi:hypothetical protein
MGLLRAWERRAQEPPSVRNQAALHLCHRGNARVEVRRKATEASWRNEETPIQIRSGRSARLALVAADKYGFAYDGHPFFQSSCEREDVIVITIPQGRKVSTVAIVGWSHRSHLVTAGLPEYYARITVARSVAHRQAGIGNILPGVYVPLMAGRDWLLCVTAESGHPCFVAGIRG